MICYSSFYTTPPTNISLTVKLSNGNPALVTHKGTFHLSNKLILHDALCIPTFQFNLILARKLTHEISCCLSSSLMNATYRTFSLGAQLRRVSCTMTYIISSWQKFLLLLYLLFFLLCLIISFSFPTLFPPIPMTNSSSIVEWVIYLIHDFLYCKKICLLLLLQTHTYLVISVIFLNITDYHFNQVNIRHPSPSISSIVTYGGLTLKKHTMVLIFFNHCRWLHSVHLIVFNEQ